MNVKVVPTRKSVISRSLGSVRVGGLYGREALLLPCKRNLVVLVMFAMMLGVGMFGMTMLVLTAAKAGAPLQLVVLVVCVAAGLVTPALVVAYQAAGGELLWRVSDERLAVGRYIGPIWFGRQCSSDALALQDVSDQEQGSVLVGERLMGLSRGSILLVCSGHRRRFGANLDADEARQAIRTVEGWYT